jgi:hypothetical protein
VDTTTYIIARRGHRDRGQIVLEGLRVVGIETVVEQIAEVESGQGKKR